jgi:hypothetical protein
MMSCSSFSSQRLRLIANKYTEVVEKKSETGTATFIEQGGRLLGMFPKGDGPNSLWVNPDLEVILKEQRPHSGGERLWISPERNFFYENPRDLTGFHIPAEIDPGNYGILDNLDPSAGTITLENKFSLLEYRSNTIIDGNITRRQFSPLSDPYRTNLPYIGFSISDIIAINTPEITIGCSSITQVPTGGYRASGVAFIVNKPKTSLVCHYTNPLPPDLIMRKENHTLCKIDSLKKYKVCIKPEDIVEENPCKIVYLAPNSIDNEHWTCVIKRSIDLPYIQEQCVETPVSNPSGTKIAMSISNSDRDGINDEVPVNSGELELHFKKGKKTGNKTISKAKHELLSYYGTKQEVMEIALTALHLSEELELYCTN